MDGGHGHGATDDRDRAGAETSSSWTTTTPTWSAARSSTLRRIPGCEDSTGPSRRSATCAARCAGSTSTAAKLPRSGSAHAQTCLSAAVPSWWPRRYVNGSRRSPEDPPTSRARTEGGPISRRQPPPTDGEPETVDASARASSCTHGDEPSLLAVPGQPAGRRRRGDRGRRRRRARTWRRSATTPSTARPAGGS